MIGRRAKPSSAETDKPKGFDDYDLRLGDLMRGERATLGKSLLDVQRELKIKAAYIAAIENADISAFETQGFIAGYVRSYARYLGMEPDLAFQKFCREANFEVAHGMSAAASSAKAVRARPAQELRDPLANPNATFVPRGESILSRIEPGAVGSLAVLVGLIGLIGYGGWSVLQEVQRVQLAPIDQAPAVVAEIDPLGNVSGAAPLVRSAPETSDAAMEMAGSDPVAQAERMDRLYRPQALDLPVLTSRDGPIAAINPRSGGAMTDSLSAAVDSALSEALSQGSAVQVVAEAQPGVELVAVRPAWVQVKASDGTVLFEKILDAGERWSVPQLEEPPVLRAGNSGAVYFAINGQAYGPAAPGAQVVKNLALSPESLADRFALADCARDPDLRRVASADESAAIPLCPTL